MEGGGSGSGTGSVALPLEKKSLLTQLQTKWVELEKGFQGWVCKQPFLVETAAVAATYALQGAVAGLFYGTLAQSEAINDFLPFEEFGKTRLVQVRNFSVLRGTDGAMICALRRIRGGKDDTKARTVAAFTSGFMFQMVRDIPSPSAPEAIASGLLFAVCQGLMHELVVRSNLSELEDTHYNRTRFMLSNLGLQNYEKNFKKNLLTDNTIPLLKERDLEKAGIPLGPRILILDHIQRDPNLRYTVEAEDKHQGRP